MSIKDDFKRHIQAGEIEQALALAISAATDLEVTTQIGASDRGEAHHIRTQINLLEGKIANQLGEAISEPAYQELYQFHLEQVKEAQTIMLYSIQALQKTLAMLKTTREPKLPPHQILP